MSLWRTLPVAALTTLAVAIPASTASAGALHVEGTTGPFTVKGEQAAEENIVYTIENGLAIKCKTATFAGTVASTTSETLNLTPTYSGCTAFGLSATVHPTCHDGFTFFLLSTLQFEEAFVYDIICEAAKHLLVTAGTCELQFGAQSGITEIAGVDQATSPKTIEVRTRMTGLSYNKTKDGFLCPLSGTGEKQDGKVDGELSLKAFEGETQVGAFLE